MPQKQCLTGKRFGRLTVLERLPEKEDRYFTWRCRCDCGGEIVVNTKRLTRGTITNCGCVPKKTAHNGSIVEDLTGHRFGKLIALERVKNISGRTAWLCRCDCGNDCIVKTHELKAGKTTSCGCHRRYMLKNRRADLRGMKFGRLTALFPTEKRDEKGSVYWRCRCDCGKETEMTQNNLVFGSYRSCGCRKKEIQEAIPTQLTFVDGTCVEWLNSRKSRSDNTSGFRGVFRAKSGNWRVSIGLQSRRYHLGTFGSFPEAVAARLEAESTLHDGFVKAYRQWEDYAELNPQWARQNPFYFHVERAKNGFSVNAPGESLCHR